MIREKVVVVVERAGRQSCRVVAKGSAARITRELRECGAAVVDCFPLYRVRLNGRLCWVSVP